VHGFEQFIPCRPIQAEVEQNRNIEKKSLKKSEDVYNKKGKYQKSYLMGKKIRTKVCTKKYKQNINLH
jgi:hypothetical protein